MKLTRDSVIWWFGIGTAIIGAITANLNLLPAELLPYKEWIIFTSVVLGSVSGKMATSPLKGEYD